MAKEIKNYLKSVKDITAPLNWKSSPDSPPTQLAYVTQPEIDMLVKANIHGSMNGKPNKGPKGIISLDGGGDYAAETKTDKKPKGASTGASQVQASQQQQQNFAEYVASQGGTSAYESSGKANQSEIDKVREGKKEVEPREEEDKEQKSQQQQVLNMLFGSEGDTSVKKSAFEKSGKHPLRAQLDYLIAKYGDDVVNTEQGKVLMGYLAGVPVERGGGLGARDESAIGPTNVDDIPMYDPVTGKYRSLEERQALAEAAKAREDALNIATNWPGADELTSAFYKSFLEKADPEILRKGLSPDQYFRFRQQLMATDPTPGNQLYKDAFPFSSGAGLGAILEKVIPGANAISAITGGILPERNMAGYQGTNDPFAATFKALPQSQSGSSGIMTASSAPSVPPVVPPTTPDVPPVVPPVVPPPTTTTTPFDLAQFYAGLPTFNQSPYARQGLGSYNEILRRYYG
jgi:hypothetical protein